MTSLGSPSPFFLAGKKAYIIDHSLRFNRDDPTYLNRTPSSSSISTKATLSFWFKPSTLISGTNGGNFFAKGNTSYVQYFNESFYIGNSSYWMNTAALLRDFSAWYHAVVVIDTTQATATNRQKVYLNNVLQARGSTVSDPAQNANYDFLNDTSEYFIGKRSSGQALHGYMAEINFVDGLAYDPSYFGETDAITGQWNPKKYVGSYGTNGFYLNFSDNSGTTATTLGKDSSGNGNNFTPNNFAVSDAVKDSPTNNFATLDVLAESGGTYSEGNLKVVGTSDPSSSNIGFASGKFYYEAYIDATSNIYVGVIPIDFGLNPARGGNWTHGAIAYRSSGQQYKLKAGGGYSSVSASYGASYTAGDIIGCAVDIDNDTVTFYKNGVSQGNTSDGVSYITASGTTSIYGALVYCNGGNNTFRLNFGQDSTFQGTVSAGGNTDANGIGDFKYTVPTGYKALCSANLSDPTILLPNKQFDTFLYTATGNAMSFPSELNFQPAWIWQKSRNSTSSSNVHYLTDAVRGGDKGLVANSTNAEFSGAAITFTSNGYDMGASSGGQGNGSGNSYVSWNWNAGDADGKTYTVKVVSDSGNKYRFDDFGTSAVTLDLAEGGTYIFDQSDASNATHPLRFYTAADKTGGEYTTGVTTAGTPGQAGAYTQIVVAASAPTLYYQCSAHANMGGQANTNSTLGSSNFEGNTQATVKVNATAGFSIISWTAGGTSSGTYDTFGHGLGVRPNLLILKNRSSAGNWNVYNSNFSSANNKILQLSNNIAETTSSNYWGADNTTPSSTLVHVNQANYSSGAGANFIMYAFSEVAGYSKFGSYTGNGSSDGTFVFTGFRPAVVIQKRTDTTGHWYIFDNKRNGFNVDNDSLSPNLSDAEYDVTIIDLLSNGFKLRINAVAHNASGGTYIYLAFAESPFKNARAR